MLESSPNLHGKQDIFSLKINQLKYNMTVSALTCKKVTKWYPYGSILFKIRSVQMVPML